jgi:hypothetical protein
MAEKKTILNQYADVVKFLTENDAPAEMVEFINDRARLHAKKAENRKPTKTQVANEGLREKVLEIVRTADKPLTATEILNTDVATLISVQKVTALLTPLVNDGRLVKTADKHRTVYTVKTE